MADSSTTTDLIIRARDIQTKPLDDLLLVLQRLTGALDQLDKEGGPATKSLQELRAEAEKFGTVSAELAGRHALAGSFQEAGRAARDAQASLDAARRAQADFAATLEAGAKVTKEQKEQTKALAKEVAAQERAFNNASRVVRTASEALQRAGVDMSNLDSEYAKLAPAVEAANAAFDRATRNVQGHAQSVRDLAAATKAKAEGDAVAARAALELAAAERKAEQAQHDILALREQAGRAGQLVAGRAGAASELAALRESEAFSRKFHADQAAAAEASALAQEQATARLNAHEKQMATEAKLRDADMARAADEAARIQEEATARLNLQEEQRLTGLAKLDAALRAQKAAELSAAADLRNLGQEAQQAALATDKLVLATDKLATEAVAPVQNLVQQVQALTQPAKAAAQSLDQVAASIAQVEARQAEVAAGGKGSREAIQALAADYDYLGQVQRNSAKQAAQLDDYRRLRQEFDETGSAIANARAALQLYAAAARQAGTSDAELEQGILTQRQELTALSASYERQGAALGRMVTSLHAAGIDVKDLAGAEKQLLANVERATAALAAASVETTTLGTATARARREAGAFGEEQRTALSLFQRIRGQILSLTAAYVGLFGVINEAKAALAATTQSVAIENRLSVAFGDDPAIVADQLKRIRGEADRLGLSLNDAAGGYSRFAIAAQAGGLSADQSFFVFSKFSEVARTFKLGGEETGRVFKALEQIMSKGKFQSEEVRQQLGDSLPGAFNKLAASMKMTTPELEKAMEQGRVSSKNILLFAQEYADAVKNKVISSSQTWQAQLGRLTTALFDFRNKVADDGFTKAMTAFADLLARTLGGDSGVKNAQALSSIFEGFVAVFTVLVPLAEGFFNTLAGQIEVVKSVLTPTLELVNGLREMIGLKDGALAFTDILRELGRVLLALGEFWVITKIVQWGGAITKAGFALKWAGDAVVALGGVINTVLVAALVGLMAYDLGTWAYNNFGWVKKVGITLVNDLFVIVAVLKNAVPIVVDTISLVVRAVFQKLMEGVAGIIQWTGEKLAGVLGAVGLAKASDALLAATKDFGKEYVAELKKSTLKAEDEFGKSWDRMGDDVARVIDTTKGAFAEIDKIVTPAGPAPYSNEGRGKPFRVNMKPELGAAKPDLRAQHHIEAITNEVATLEATAAKKSADDLSEILHALDLKYKKLFDDIATLPEAISIGLNTRAKAALETLRQVATEEFQLKKSKERVASLTAERDAKIELVKIEADLDPSKRTEKMQEEIAVLNEYRNRLADASYEQLAAATTSGNLVDATKARIAIAKLAAQDPEREARRAQLADALAMVQALTQERDARIAAAVQVADARDPTGATGMAETVRLMTEYRDRIGEAATQARGLADGLGDKNAVANMDAVLARLPQVDAELEKMRLKLGQDLVTGFTDVGVAAVGALADIARGAKGAGDALGAVRNAFKSFAASFLDGVVKMIVQTQVLAFWEAVANIGAPVVGGPGIPAGSSPTIGASLYHSGGMVGGPSNWSRSMPSMAFAGAPRMHSGGMVGLGQDERTAILQVGEEVLSKRDPRNALNGGTMPATTASPQAINIVNTIDPQEVIDHALSTPAGQRSLVNAIGVRKSEIKKLLA